MGGVVPEEGGSALLPVAIPQDNEMYLLFHIPDGASSLLAFTVTCTGSYTVATGTVQNGAFVQSGAVSIASGQKYETELFAGDFGNLTSDGMKQCMVKEELAEAVKMGITDGSDPMALIPRLIAAK